LSCTDDCPAHMFGERMKQIRDLANEALIELDGIEDKRDSVWGDLRLGDYCETAHESSKAIENTRRTLRNIQLKKL